LRFFQSFIIYHIGIDQNRGIDPSTHRKRLVSTSCTLSVLVVFASQITNLVGQLGPRLSSLFK
ncbi:unnamed protein product, partial [Brassica rapa]